MLLSEIHNSGILVYHGSRFDFDEFDMSKIGIETEDLKGGWGIYFSDDRDVAEGYSTGQGTVKAYTIPSHRRYFNLDEGVEDTETILAKLEAFDLASESDLEEFREEFVEEEYRYDTTNRQLYGWLSHVLGSNKEASEFLHNEMGYIGTMYKDKTNPDATNYVIFDPKYISSYQE